MMRRVASFGERALLGREEEFARLAAFLDRVSLGPAGLVLEGEAGIGKTELWRSAVVSARERGYMVLEARPSEAERGLSFAGLADLLAPVCQEVAALPSPQRRPLAAALLLEDDGGAPPDPRTIAAGTLGLLRRLAAERSLLVAVDDVQWLDRPSGAALAFALRRLLASEPVGALLARRSGEPGSLDLDRSGEQERIEVGPLSLGAARRMLSERFGVSFSRTTLHRLHDRAGGNPFYVLELARALQARGGTLAPGDELPLPDDIGRLLRDRLALLPPETAEPLAAIAALGEPQLRRVVADTLEPAFTAGVLVLDGDRVRFSHPLLAAAAYEALTPISRQALHRRLAGAVEDPEHRAHHLALAASGPDPELGAVLEEAAGHAHRRGAPEAAAVLAERALSIDDSATADTLARRTAAAADYHVLAGDDRRARELLERALDRSPRGPSRALLLRGLALCTEQADPDAATVLLEQARREAGGDAQLEAEILGLLASWISRLRSVGQGESLARAALAAAERVGDPCLVAAALTRVAADRFELGRGLPAELMQRALGLEPECDSLPVSERPVTIFGWMCEWAGDVDGSRALLERARRIGEQRGDSTVGVPLFYSCWLELLAENWLHGLELADELHELGLATDRDEVTARALATRVVLLAHVGDEDGARRGAVEAQRVTERERVERLTPFGLGLLELSLDRPQQALEHVRRERILESAAGVEEPALYFSFPIHAEAAIAVGELEEAEEVLDWIEERAVRLDREWALACAARCRGLLAAARGDEARAAAAFERALAEHARVQYRRFDLARTLLAQGETLRRFRRKSPARGAIEAALAIFEELGAALWEAKARRELARISGRRGAQGLTVTERRVAELVAGGLSTKETAAALVVSPKTVEGHLSRIYVKLGVRSRTQLAQRLSRE